MNLGVCPLSVYFPTLPRVTKDLLIGHYKYSVPFQDRYFCFDHHEDNISVTL